MFRILSILPFQTLLSVIVAFLTIVSLLLISLESSPLLANIAPRYVNAKTFSIGTPSSIISWPDGELWHCMPLVFLVFPHNPTFSLSVFTQFTKVWSASVLPVMKTASLANLRLGILCPPTVMFPLQSGPLYEILNGGETRD